MLNKYSLEDCFDVLKYVYCQLSLSDMYSTVSEQVTKLYVPLPAPIGLPAVCRSQAKTGTNSYLKIFANCRLNYQP